MYLNLKMAKDLNKHSSKEDMQIAKKLLRETPYT